MGHINRFCRKLMWLITLIYATFVLELIPKVLVISPQEDLGSWTHIISTLTRQLEWPTFNCFHVIGHFMVATTGDIIDNT